MAFLTTAKPFPRRSYSQSVHFSCVLVPAVSDAIISNKSGIYKNLVGQGASSTLGSSGRRADGAIFIIRQRGRFG